MMSILKFCKRSVVPLFLGVMILVGCRAGDSGNSAEQMTVPPVEAVSLVGAQKLLVVATTNIIGDQVDAVQVDPVSY